MEKNWLYLGKQMICIPITQKLYCYLYPKHFLLHTHQETCPRTFTELFATVNNWNGMSINSRKEKMCCIHIMLWNTTELHRTQLNLRIKVNEKTKV